MHISLFTILAIIVIMFVVAYIVIYILLTRRIYDREQHVVDIFLAKIAKIPAVIEVMRPYVVDEHLAFDLITRLHSESIIHEYSSIPMLLEHNARINDQYGFLMRLSMAIPELQRDTYFIYIRDYVMSYDRMMRN